MPAVVPSLAPPRHAALAIVERGGMPESVHYGSIAIVDAEGRLIASAGDPDAVTFTRSALKPFQAMPVLASGAAAAFGFAEEEIALMCASHSGEPRHVDIVSRMLARIGCGCDDLQCGVHTPTFYQWLDRTPEPGATFTTLHNNCSGKHTGMLAWCRHCGEPTASYLDSEHPLQREIRRAVAHFTRVAEAALVPGIDGCSAPNYALPLAGLARAFARLARNADDERYGDAPRRIFDAMRAHPALVSGERRSDLALMTTGEGDWATKVGAEGVQGIAVRSRGLGIAIKIADGSRRGLFPVIVAVLEQLRLVGDAASTPIGVYREPAERNMRGLVTGRVRTVVELALH
jgi:L-asparaginase II